MNTLLPFPSFSSLGLLSNADLGTQIYEAGEILYTLTQCPVGWYKNQAAMQWYGCLHALKSYYNHCIVLWGQRGFTVDRKIEPPDLFLAQRRPAWVGDPRVHAFHRATLLNRNPAFYARYTWQDRLDTKAIYPDMHRYGAQVRGHVPTDYKPMVEYNWSKFFGSFHV